MTQKYSIVHKINTKTENKGEKMYIIDKQRTISFRYKELGAIFPLEALISGL